MSITSIGNPGSETLVPPLRDVVTATSSGGSATGSTPTANLVPGPNPSRHFDHASGIVVLQFVSANGTVTETIPTQRQLDAFRISQEAVNQVDSSAPASSGSSAQNGGTDVVQGSVATTTITVRVPPPTHKT